MDRSRDGFQAALERVLAGDCARVSAADETQWWSNWQALWAAESCPSALALMAGATADRMAWVFAGGYQVAVRRAWPELSLPGCACVAVSERADDAALPPLTWHESDGATLLSGVKTWVAAAQVSRHLIVKAGRGADARWYVVDATQDGVQVKAGPRARFLADLSQGQAHFDQVPIVASAAVAATGAVRFSAYEGRCVSLASIGFMLRAGGAGMSVHWQARAASAAVTLAGAIDDDDFDSAAVRLGAAGAGVALAALAAEFISTVDLADEGWSSDQRLLAMFCPMLQKRGGLEPAPKG